MTNVESMTNDEARMISNVGSIGHRSARRLLTPPRMLCAGLRCLLETCGQPMWHGRETGHNFGIQTKKKNHEIHDFDKKTEEFHCFFAYHLQQNNQLSVSFFDRRQTANRSKIQQSAVDRRSFLVMGKTPWFSGTDYIPTES